MRLLKESCYERQRDRLGEELTLVQIDRHSTLLEELGVEGILAFAERVLPKTSEVHASLDQRQRLQQLSFPEGMPLDGPDLCEFESNDQLAAASASP